MEELIRTEVLIIGCGVGGGVAALQLADAGISVTVITRAKEPTDSNTYHAQGGIIYKGVEDNPEWLCEDIQRAGVGYCNPKAVRTLAEEGPKLVEEILINKAEVEFDKLGDGSLSLAREGGHGVPRIVHATDATGRSIEIALMRRIKGHPNVRLLTGCTAIDLLTPSHHSKNRLSVYEPLSVVGAYVLNQEDGTIFRCIAKHTIVATGGLGQLFLYTTNPEGSRGDGVAMAYRAGARVINMEFVQFHPTTFYHRQAPRFLISEAVRGDGARLVNANDEPFMQKYNEEWKDLAPRDVVARSIYSEMLENDVPNVYLDLRSFIPENRIHEHFPNIFENCKKYGVDISKDLLPVVPGAHYSCGGIWVDDWGQTTLDRLYAVGEVACTGLHGANRLASTSLLEGLVWGERAARHILAHMNEREMPDCGLIPEWQDDKQYVSDPALIGQDMTVIKSMMWNYVGLVRTKYRLARALGELRHLESEIERFYRMTVVNDDLLGLRNAVRCAVIVAASAWSNKTSVGCHYRE